MYPIKFKNIYYDKIWGGQDLSSFRKNLPKGNIGESWDIACHANGMSVVENGQFKGMSLNELIETFKKDLIGIKVDLNNFPLLVKLINSKDKLSIQVHPNDEYARKHENQLGKTEAWYVIDAKEDAELVVGTKNCDKKTFEEAIRKGNCEDYLNTIKVKKGDCFLINSGLVHAIGKGLIIAEIQQNSDVTYRVFDYGRPRELHIKKSLDVIDFNIKAINLSNNKETSYEGYSIIDFCENEYFGMKKIKISKMWIDNSDLNRFYILTCVDGSGYIESKNHKEEINTGDSLLIPSSLGEYKVTGEIELIKSYPV